jgi:putative ABC transport system permease protein
MTFVIRTAGDPGAVAPLVRRAVARLDGSVAPFDARTMEERMANAVTQQRLSVWIFAFFGTAALVLAALGVGGVVAFAVSSRTREIGVRIALGASRSGVLRLVVMDGLRLALLGLASASAWRSRWPWLTALLFQTTPADPGPGHGEARCWPSLWSPLPAQRAALRLDPDAVLRTDDTKCRMQMQNAECRMP